MGGVLVMGTLGVVVPVRSQPHKDIVRIGESPAQWQHFNTQWQQLLDLSRGAAQDRRNPASVNSLHTAQQIPLQQVVRNLRVRNLRLEYIIKLNGSSELMGDLTNNNPIPITVTAVNFEILDAKGNLIQTGSAKPEPSTIQPGQSVTFSKTLLTVPPDVGFRVRLARPALVIASY